MSQKKHHFRWVCGYASSPVVSLSNAICPLFGQDLNFVFLCIPFGLRTWTEQAMTLRELVTKFPPKTGLQRLIADRLSFLAVAGRGSRALFWPFALRCPVGPCFILVISRSFRDYSCRHKSKWKMETRSRVCMEEGRREERGRRKTC